ncbi:hypothetical protein B0H63DRAFT_83716 [Podospora didyma]|uniref:VOC domain-containing protein n=1 Tax=Podospora didyma TaxID=330526 RepID=A0AAE0K088_9PEZI|nr:hypothetical protein B0H63DRAFT_83716 [Podospora didyma]
MASTNSEASSAQQAQVAAAAPTWKLESIAPVFCTGNLERWLEHYKALGFEVSSYGNEYGYAILDGVKVIHAQVNPYHSPTLTDGCAYLYVDDADAVFAVWSVAPHTRRHLAPRNTEYGLREGGHIDPDGNLIRYGSRIRNAE